MIAPPGTSALLGVEDLADGEELHALLDTTLLDKARDAALTLSSGNTVEELPFVAKRLHVFMTVGNLHGVPYDISFTSTAGNGQTVTAQHTMLMHGDRLHFAVHGLGSGTASASEWGDKDQPIEVDVGQLIGAGAAPPEWLLYGNAAVASGAFPVGLRPRILNSEALRYHDRQWPMPVPKAVSITPNASWGDGSYRFANVDGGTINNEPFETARWTLLKKPFDSVDPHNPPDGIHVDRALIMIDPFPAGPTFKFDDDQKELLTWALGKIVPLFLNQARFKPAELVAASDEARYSRFMIAPSRKGRDDAQDSDKPYYGTEAIACGLLGGFGGFFDEKFRAHDYQLGRRNCQWFLRHTFTVPADSKAIATWSAAAKSNKQFQSPGDVEVYYQLIPLMGTANLEVPQPRWEKMSGATLQALPQWIRRRTDAVFDRLLPSLVKNWWARQALKPIWGLWGLGTLVDFVLKKIDDDLTLRRQK